MIEYEVKFQADPSILDQVIEDLSYVGKKQQNDIYYDTYDYKLFLNAVFLRKRNNSVIDIKYNFDKSDISHLFCNENRFNYPLSKNDSHSLDCFLSQLIQSVEIEEDIIKKYQLNEYVVINKTRDIYQGVNIEVSFDFIDKLGYFIEIEAKTKDGIDFVNYFLNKNNIQRIKTGYVELYLKQNNFELYRKGKYLID